MTKISVAAIGECMIEFSADGEDRWKSSYAGDTFNTLWTMRALLPEEARLDYVTAFGDDPFSQKQRAFFSTHDIGIAHSPTINGSRPGLYAITLDGFERSFTYWRNEAAARHLADNAEAVRLSIAGKDLIYFSGITLAILSVAKRKTLLDELNRARLDGSKIAFDPNYRDQLWTSSREAKQAFATALEISDIALPTFDDERCLYGDNEPEATVARLRSAGVPEVVVKCGGDPAWFAGDHGNGTMAAQCVQFPIDTTGAGDAFNGGYLSARLMGRSIETACRIGHEIAAVKIQHRGALSPSMAIRESRVLT